MQATTLPGSPQALTLAQVAMDSGDEATNEAIYHCARYLGLDDSASRKCERMGAIEFDGVVVWRVRAKDVAGFALDAGAAEWLLTAVICDLSDADFVQSSVYCAAMLQLNTSSMLTSGACLCSDANSVVRVMRPLTGGEQPAELAALMHKVARVVLSVSTLPAMLPEALKAAQVAASGH